jgi:hypothetical protein
VHHSATFHTFIYILNNVFSKICMIDWNTNWRTIKYINWCSIHMSQYCCTMQLCTNLAISETLFRFKFWQILSIINPKVQIWPHIFVWRHYFWSSHWKCLHTKIQVGAICFMNGSHNDWEFWQFSKKGFFIIWYYDLNTFDNDHTTHL